MPAYKYNAPTVYSQNVEKHLETPVKAELLLDAISYLFPWSISGNGEIRSFNISSHFNTKFANLLKRLRLQSFKVWACNHIVETRGINCQCERNEMLHRSHREQKLQLNLK